MVQTRPTTQQKRGTSNIATSNFAKMSSNKRQATSAVSTNKLFDVLPDDSDEDIDDESDGHNTSETNNPNLVDTAASTSSSIRTISKHKMLCDRLKKKLQEASTSSLSTSAPLQRRSTDDNLKISAEEEQEKQNKIQNNNLLLSPACSVANSSLTSVPAQKNQAVEKQKDPTICRLEQLVNHYVPGASPGGNDNGGQTMYSELQFSTQAAIAKVKAYKGQSSASVEHCLNYIVHQEKHLILLASKVKDYLDLERLRDFESKQQAKLQQFKDVTVKVVTRLFMVYKFPSHKVCVPFLFLCLSFIYYRHVLFNYSSFYWLIVVF